MFWKRSGSLGSWLDFSRHLIGYVSPKRNNNGGSNHWMVAFSAVIIIAAALVNLSLRMMGLVWMWNPLTIILGAGALLVLSGLIFAVLSVVGMPGQVYLQNYGVRFIASRNPALEALWRQAAAGPRR